MAAIENLVIARVELAMTSINASSGHEVGSVVLDPDPRDFSGKIEGLLKITSIRRNSLTDLNRIDETRGNITVKGGDLLVNEKILTGKQTPITDTATTFCYRLNSCSTLEYTKLQVCDVLGVSHYYLREFVLKVNFYCSVLNWYFHS